MRIQTRAEIDQELVMKSPYLDSGHVSPNFSQKELPSWAPGEGRKGEFLLEKSLDGFATDATLSDSPPYCFLQPSETVHPEDFSCMRRMEQAPLPTVFPAHTMYCVQSAPYSLASPFHSPSGPLPLPSLVSSCPSFGSDASYSRSPSFSSASSSHSPIYSSSLTAKHSSSFGPNQSSSFGPGPFFNSYPNEPPSSYSSFRSFVSQVTHSIPTPSSFESPEHDTALTGLPHIGQFVAPAESRSIQEILPDQRPLSSHPPPLLSSVPTTRSILTPPVAPPPLPHHPQSPSPVPVRSLVLALKSTSKPFPCHPCSKGFERSEHLTRHRATDSHLRTLKAKGIPCFDPPVTLTRCPFCDQKFNRSDNLNPHLITHMHSRPEGEGRGSKGVSVEEVARNGLSWLDPRVNPRVRGAKMVRKGGRARVKRR